MKISFLIAWGPYLLISFIFSSIGSFFGWLAFEKGYTLPEIVSLSVRYSIRSINSIENLINYYKEKKKMPKITSLKSDQVQEFTPECENDIKENERTVFLCKFLDVKDAAAITDDVYTAKGFGKKREERLRAGTQDLTILRKGLVGWKNFVDEKKVAVEWETPVGSHQKIRDIVDRNLNKIPPDTRGEIADFIRGASNIDQD
jgi:hypothetical protein